MISYYQDLAKRVLVMEFDEPTRQLMMEPERALEVADRLREEAGAMLTFIENADKRAQLN